MVRKSNQSTIREVIQKLISSYHLDDKLKEVQIINHWEKVVGKVIAKHTQKLYIKHGKLFVKLDSPALKEELSFSKSKIIDLINEEVKEKLIEDLVFI